MIVFITGASAGFGQAIARTFVHGGHQVVATARRKERLDALAQELGSALLPLELDVRDRAACEALPSQLPGRGVLGVLVRPPHARRLLQPAVTQGSRTGCAPG